MQRIFHPTDLSLESVPAFHHALRLAWASGSRLTVMHVDNGREAHLADLPGIRKTLHAWGALRSENDLAGLEALGVGVRKLVASESDPVVACVDYLERHPADLVVLATGQHQGRSRWLERSVSEEIARSVITPTLFVPHGCTGFVDATTGVVASLNVLMPVAIEPSSAKAVGLVELLWRMFPEALRQGRQLHVGEGRSSIEDSAPAGWQRSDLKGDVVERIAEHALAVDPDIVVMATRGGRGLFGALFGSVTEQTLRHSKYPVLAVPDH